MVIVGAAGAVTQLTYAVPPALTGRVQCGHRVLVPMRSRRLTGLVIEVGAELDSGGAEPRAILEVLEARPLFDRAHLQLLEFLGTYYMAPLAEVYRNVVPGIARVESRRMFKLGAPPGPLATAALTATERAILDALDAHPRTPRQLERLGERSEVATAIVRLGADGLIDAHDATRGRHRETAPPIVRLCAGATAIKLRGPKQRQIIERLGASGAAGLRLDALEAALPGARAAIRTMVTRGVVEMTAGAPDVSTNARAPIAADTFGDTPSDDAAAADTTSSDAPAGDAYIQAAIDAAPFELSPEQIVAIAAAAPAVREHRFETFLLWGVTASGKTEVYLRLAAEALAAGRQVLIMVPEIALADQIVRSFRSRFGALVGVAHSAQNVAERWASWMAALNGAARIMIGPRSIIFAPLHEPGLIVVDEEHDAAYKNEDGVRYNARDLAVTLGRFANCPVMLGSATPSAESYVNTRRGRYRMLRLPRRAGDRALAEVEIIDLREYRPGGARADPSGTSRGARSIAAANETGAANGAHASRTAMARTAESSADATGNAAAAEPVPISPPMVAALRANLAARGQSVVFLNRRGFHNFLQCHLCGNVIACPNCSVSLTFHLRDRSLRCHFCGESAPAPDRCPECDGLGLQGQGFGTERLVQALAELMPDARIERMDSDTSGRRGARAAILDALARGEIDVLAGTQMITKGFDFPGVTLVGVVLADLALNLPDFRSAERTFQLLTQVAGRAGRGTQPGRVLIQTYAPHHYSIRAARDQDYARFIRRELDLRRELMYPPFARMALVRVEGADNARTSQLAARAAGVLGRFARPDTMRILGPAPAPIERIKQRYRWQVAVKARELNDLRAALTAMRAEVATAAEAAHVRVIIDIDPINML
ncbi:MAG TPA: primosomal protein N' [Candidatus Binataceae bacterium]|nr:primosomal protein N' [Candidatus Binataceae bacterium]